MVSNYQNAKIRNTKNAKRYRHRRDSNSQSLPPESNALPLGHGASHPRFIEKCNMKLREAISKEMTYS